jgi:hypothetical protein
MIFDPYVTRKTQTRFPLTHSHHTYRLKFRWTYLKRFDLIPFTDHNNIENFASFNLRLLKKDFDKLFSWSSSTQVPRGFRQLDERAQK